MQLHFKHRGFIPTLFSTQCMTEEAIKALDTQNAILLGCFDAKDITFQILSLLKPQSF